MRDATKIIRSTLSRSAPGEPLHSGPVFAAPYHTPGDPVDTPYTYARSHNPTWTSLEKAIGQMESGEGYRASALVFASGMAACAAVFGAVLRPGDVVVLPSNAYYTARVLMQEYFAKMGVVLRMAPTAGNAQAELLEGARLLWLESPSNPGMEMWAQIDQWRTLTGAALGPMEAWLALRSIATLPLRLERSSENAQRIAEFLARRDEVVSVLYPGLPNHPGHAIAKKQMRYFGPVLSFILRDKSAAETFLAKSKLLTEATSFGGVTTTAERRARWGGDAIAEGFIRMSAGCEAVEDLIEDITQALGAVR